MFEIYLIAAFWFLASVISTIIANRVKISIVLMETICNKFFLPKHLLTEPVLDDQAPEILTSGKRTKS
jgi:hypothetical protein